MSRSFDPFAPKTGTVQLIEASAGTGKTHSITSLYLRLFLEEGLGVEQILVVTFTEAATAELRERIRFRLRAALTLFSGGEASADPFLSELLSRSQDRERDRRRLLAAAGDLDRASIFTIHGFCRRMLQQHALETGLFFDLELTGSTGRLIRELVDDYWVESFHDQDPRLAAFLFRDFSYDRLLSFAVELLRRSKHQVTVAGRSEPTGELLSAERNRLQAEFHRLYDSARHCWLESAGELAGYFAGAPGLSAPFQALLADGLLDRLAAFFADEQATAYLLPAKTELLTAERLFAPDGKVFTKTALKKGEVRSHPFFAIWGELAAGSDGLAQICQAAFLSEAAGYFRRELPARLLAARQQSFDQLLLSLADALAAEPGPILARRILTLFPAALIDEFQDTDPVQAAIFKAVYGKGDGSLFLIGDPKQAIYSFRGADIHAYLEIAEHAASELFTMDTNYRSDPGLVAAVGGLFGSVETAFFDERLSFHPVRPRPEAEDLWSSEKLGRQALQFLTLPEDLLGESGKRPAKKDIEAAVPELLAVEIARILADGAQIGGRVVKAGDIAVLVRSNRQADRMQEALRDHGITAVLHSRASVFAGTEAGDCLRLLAAVAKPHDERLIRTALATVTLGFSAADLDRLSRKQEELQGVMARFLRWRELWRKNGVMAMLLAVWQESGAIGRLLSLVDGDRRLTNLRHLGELLQQVEQQRRLGQDLLIDWLFAAINQDEAAEEAELRLESDENAVQLVTVHRSKGLQYPVVYCPFLCFGNAAPKKPLYATLHDPADNWRGKMVLLPDAAALKQAAAEAFAEELRLLYVALTRARHCCLVLWAPAKGYERTALGYLLHAGLAGPAIRRSVPDWQAFLEGLDGRALLDDLRRQAAKNEGWLVRELAADPGMLPAAARLTAEKLSFRVPLRKFSRFWRTGSFSQLSARPKAEAEEWTDAWSDREPESRIALPIHADRDETAEETKLPLASFPRGALAGNFFHRIFECVSFQEEADAPELLKVVDEQLRFYGFEKEPWSAPVRRALAEILRTPLGGPSGFSLRDLPDGKRLNEMPFFFPVGPVGEAGKHADRGLDPLLLAQAFRDHPQGLPAGYADSLAGLGFTPLCGFLKGFIDLIFEHRGRWYLLDYKSNHLGDSPAGYRPERLVDAMAAHHYYLQYHIYTVALHRYLAARLAAYAYEEHFGGVFYLFFRGMRPDPADGSGVFYDLPPKARIEDLSRIFKDLASG